jgi:hypothetical protein
MMNSPIPEIGSKYLSFYRFIYNKANAWFGYIFAFNNLVGKGKQICFQMFFKSKGIYGIPLVFSCIKICLKQIERNLILVYSENKLSCCILCFL